MKQSEKLDVILRYLYERRNERRDFSITEILKESNIQADENEIGRLANQLLVGARLQRAAAASIFENGVGGHALKTRASLRV